MLRSSKEEIYGSRRFYISRLIIMVITIVKPDEEIRNECKNLLNQTVDIDWLKKFYHSFIKWNKIDRNYPKVNTHDKEYSREQLNRSIKTADRIRGYIQDTVMYLSQEEKEQIFSMLADKMNIKTEAKAMLEKILSSKKSQWQENKS